MLEKAQAIQTKMQELKTEFPELTPGQLRIKAIQLIEQQEAEEQL